MGRLNPHDGICVLILCVLAIVVCWPAFQSRTIPLDTRALLDAPPWRDLSQPKQAPPDDAYARREALTRYPDFAFMVASMERDDSLLWSPLEYGGTPFLARWESSALSPFSLPLRVFPFDAALRVGALLKILVAALAAYVLARALQIPPPLALCSAVAYGLSGAGLLWLGHGSSDVWPWLPIVVLGAERIAVGKLRAWPIASLGAALMILGGDLLAAGFGLVSCFIYLLARISLWRGARYRLLSIATFMIALGIGGCAAAIQLVPSLEFVNWVVEPAPFTLNMPSVLGLIESILAPAASVAGGEMLPRERALFHVGAIYGLMTLVWLAVRRHVMALHRSRVDGLFVAASLTFAMGAIPAAFQAAQGESPVGYHQVLLFLPLALGLIAPVSMQAWLELDPAQCRVALRRCAFFVPVFLAAVAILIAGDGARGLAGARLDTQGLAVEVGVLIAALILLAVTLLRPSRAVAGYGLAALCAVAALSTVPGYMVFGMPPPEPAAGSMLARLGADGQRVAGGKELEDWPLAAAGIAQTRGSAGRPTIAMRDHLNSMPGVHGRRLLVTATDLRNSDGFETLRPELTLAGAFDAGAALFDYTSGPGRVDFAGSPSVGGDGSAMIVSETNIRLEVAVELQAPSRLVIRDAYYPGWTAEVDGRPVSIGVHTGAFRGLELPAGAERVVLRYVPESWNQGVWYSTAGLALIVVGGVVWVLRNRRTANDTV